MHLEEVHGKKMSMMTMTMVRMMMKMHPRNAKVGYSSLSC